MLIRNGFLTIVLTAVRICEEQIKMIEFLVGLLLGIIIGTRITCKIATQIIDDLIEDKEVEHE